MTTMKCTCGRGEYAAPELHSPGCPNTRGLIYTGEAYHLVHPRRPLHNFITTDAATAAREVRSCVEIGWNINLTKVSFRGEKVVPLGVGYDAVIDLIPQFAIDSKLFTYGSKR
jgi:hypothetical protein